MSKRLKKGKKLCLPAIEVTQSPDKVIYSFAVDGKQISSFASISRIRRNKKKEIEGYQRSEVLSHISEIRKYIESESPMIPNTIVIAFDSSVKFKPQASSQGNPSICQTGIFEIPLNSEEELQKKPGFIVDGQQRVAAIREAEVENFPIFVTAFITDDIGEQTEQFILVNSAKPLPAGLIYELLPQTEGLMPAKFHRRRFPAFILNKLNYDDDSPLKKKIKTPTSPEGIIKDNSILRMLENSLSNGVLYRFRYTQEGSTDIDGMMEVLFNFWRAVGRVFEKEWNLPPRESRLVHGSGIIAMGFLMDAISERYRDFRIPSEEHFVKDLNSLKAICSWTEGFWDFGPNHRVKWNEVQNTGRDISTLTNYLQRQYKNLVWNRRSKVNLQT